MREGARTVAAAVPAGVVIAAAWVRVEQPLGSLWHAAALVGLALAAAALPGWRLRAAGSVVAAVGAARLVFGVWLLSLHPAAASSHLATRFGNGFLEFYATHLPFDPRVQVEMAEVVLAAVFCFVLLAALLAAGRRPVAAALALLAGAGWPATLLGPSHGTEMGAAILVAGLAVLAALGSQRVPVLVLPVAAVVVLAAVAVGSATASRHGALRWQEWNPARGLAPANVSFVWTPDYGGLNWPRHRTVVLDVRSHTPPSYLRADVLDYFVGDRWANGPLEAADSLEPAAAFRHANEKKEVVTVQGLSDIHLVGGSVPVRFAAGGAPFLEPERGFATLPDGLARGFRYTVWSYSPHPTATALARARPLYPSELDGMLDVGNGVELPPFGAPQRGATVAAMLTHEPDLYRYLPLARVAEKVTRGARTPYAAVDDLERWFLVGGHFRYANHPLVVAPALVGFVTQTRRGYCQFFAGAMALMLRYLGVPARVAVGFAGPTYDAANRQWIVNDHDAHAWVEVWFRGYGWLPFDPTPAIAGSSRGPLLASFTRRGGSAESVPSPGILQRIAAAGPKSQGKGSSLGTGTAAPSNGGGVHLSVALLLLLFAGAIVAGIAATKSGLRLVRRLEREPRRMAAACREELAAFLLDQRIELPRTATVRELGEIVRREFGADDGPFVTAAAAARFGRAEAAEDAADAARRELGILLAACRRGLTRRERLLGLLSLRSLARPRAAREWSASLRSSPVGIGGS
ncbi:MAG: transglutaminaseTgpA domain-containing protein [Gaiellaceae bacterium]